MLFVTLAAVMALTTLLVLTRPLWWPARRAAAPGAGTLTLAIGDASPVERYREQLRELDRLHEQGTLGAEAHASARAAIERKILDHVMAEPPAAAPAAPPSAPVLRRPPKLALAISAAVVAVVAAGSWWLGNDTPASGAPDEPAAAAGSQAPHELGADQIAGITDKLVARLAQQPDDYNGWAMLARTYAVTGRHDQAVPAFRKAAALRGDDPVLLADYADALAMTQQRSLAGEPIALVKKALAVDPDNVKALSLAGTEAFERKDYATALKHWERLKSVAPADHPIARGVQGAIDEARELAGLPPLPAAAPTVREGTTAPAAGAAAAAGASITGTITLAPALKAQTSPDDTLFVYARPADGSRMPVAIRRHRVADLPLRYTLDDSHAMSPAAKLSGQRQVIVSARISKDGQAMPQPGDLQGLSAPVVPGASGVAVLIDQTVGR